MKQIRLKNIIIIMIAVTLLSGCGKKSAEDKTTAEKGAFEASMVYLYYPDNNKISVKDERYQIKQPDSTSASIEEIMAAISSYYEERLQYKTYMLDSNNVLTLEFNTLYDYDKEYCLLAEAAITRTLYQIDDLSEIKIIIYSEDDKIISDEVFGRETVYYYDEEYPIGD